MVTDLKTVKKIDVQGTLLSIPKGETSVIETKLIKASSVRSAVRSLNNKGYFFESTEKGLINQIKVTRSK